MERKKPYKPGTIVTLKDGNRYRTTRAKTLACTECVNFYGDSTNTPCVKNAFIKFAWPPLAANIDTCCRLYGGSMYPKLIKNEKSI